MKASSSQARQGLDQRWRQAVANPSGLQLRYAGGPPVRHLCLSEEDQLDGQELGELAGGWRAAALTLSSAKFSSIWPSVTVMAVAPRSAMLLTTACCSVITLKASTNGTPVATQVNAGAAAAAAAAVAGAGCRLL